MSSMLSIRDLKLISADAYARGALGVTAETIMDVAADVVDMLIVREHYKISSALHIVGMTAEQYVAVRSKNGKKWWKSRDEIEDEMKKEEEQEEESELSESDYAQYSDRLKKTLAFCRDKGMSLKEVLEHFRENTHWLIRRCAKEIGYENDEACAPEKDDEGRNRTA